MAEVKCQMCGKCCSFEIPLTLLDMSRISKFLGLDEETAFNQYIQKDISKKSGLFKIRKREDSACIFLSSENRCTIQEAKPNVCAFYQCSTEINDDVLPWTSTYSEKHGQAKIWEQSVATVVTRKYIHNNHTNWNESDFEKALNSIRNNVVTKKSQRIKLARNEANEPICMIYDCLACKEAGTYAVETPITLDDISRITGSLNMRWEVFFKDCLSEELSSFGILKLKRKTQCVFFNSTTHCTIKRIRPMHCRFTPCPKKTSNNSQYDCFYLGSGTMEEQFRHQSAIVFTQEYTAKNGTQCDIQGIKKALDKMNEFLSDKDKYKEFSRNISSFRYIEDTAGL